MKQVQGAIPVDLPGADHSCVERKCTIQTCNDLKNYYVSVGRIADLGNGQFQSNIEYGFDKFDPKALMAVAQVLEQGARVYGYNAWLGRTARHHINHAIWHLYMQLDGDKEEDHLVNAFCRVMFALGVQIRTDSLEEAATSVLTNTTYFGQEPQKRDIWFGPAEDFAIHAKPIEFKEDSTRQEQNDQAQLEEDVEDPWRYHKAKGMPPETATDRAGNTYCVACGDSGAGPCQYHSRRRE